MSARYHPEHHGLKRYEMIERDFARASRDTGDVPTRVTVVIAAYYYEDLLDKLTAAQQRIAELESLNAERNRQNALAFGDRDAESRRLDWLIGEVGWRTFYDLFDFNAGNYTTADVRAAIDRALTPKEPT